MSVILEATTAEHSRVHAGKVVGHIVRALAVDPEKAAVTPHAADIVKIRASGIGSHDQRHQLGRTSAGRERIQHRARESDLLLYILDIHHWRCPRDRHGLFDRPHFQIGVHGCGEPCRQFDPVPPKRTESGQSEDDCVCAGPQVNDAVEALAIRGRGADSFDQGGAGGFYCDARNHRARCVSHHSSDGAGLRLRPRGSRQEYQTSRHDDEPQESLSVHRVPPFKDLTALQDQTESARWRLRMRRCGRNRIERPCDYRLGPTVVKGLPRPCPQCGLHG